MTAALFEILRDSTIAMTAATFVVLATRGLLRAWLGAERAYFAWLAVPGATLATLVPAIPEAGAFAASLPALPAIAALAPAADADASWTPVALGVWVAGALAAFAAFARQQRRFVRGLVLDAATVLHEGVPLRRAHAADASPASVGALRPFIALPADFESRYDAAERALVLAHEHVHVARCDGLANAALAALRCLFWFDPVVHFASRRFRYDQELACDAAVLRGRPHARRAYAEAILKTQLAVPGLPVGCHWQSSQALKERILMLKKDHTVRPRLGGAATALFVGLVALSSYASHSGPRAAAHDGGEPEVAPSYAKLVRVPYPQAAIDGRLEGDVVVKVHVGDDGTVLDAAPDTSSPQAAQVLQDAAVASISKWTFNPARKDGRAVDTWAVIRISFRLDAKSAPAPDSDGSDVISVMPEPPGAD